MVTNFLVTAVWLGSGFCLTMQLGQIITARWPYTVDFLKLSHANRILIIKNCNCYLNTIMFQKQVLYMPCLFNKLENMDKSQNQLGQKYWSVFGGTFCANLRIIAVQTAAKFEAQGTKVFVRTSRQLFLLPLFLFNCGHIR